MTVKQYVQANFTTVEQEIFDYILLSFPESLIVQENSESEEVLLLLAVLAKVVGNSKELILNLKTGHSLNEIIQKIEDDYLKENNEKLLLPLAADIKYHRLPESLETSELIERLVSEKFFIQDYYKLYKNRGTLTAITQIVKKYAEFLSEKEVTYTLYELKNSVNIVLNGLDPNEYANLAEGTLSFNFGDETIDTAFLKKDEIIYDMLMSIKPLGTKYNILFEFFAFNLTNILADRVLRDGLMDIDIKLNDSTVSATNPQIISLVTDEESNEYTLTVSNPSKLSSLKLYYTDWNNNGIFSQNTRFDTVKENWDELNEAVTPTRDNVNKKNYIFATEQQLIEYLQVITPEVGTKAIVTGYEWLETTEADYNIANRKLSINISAESTSFLTPTIFDMQNQIIPTDSVWRGAGSIVVKLIKVFGSESRTGYFRLTQVIPGGYNEGVDTVDSSNVGYFEYKALENFEFYTKIIGPDSSVSITQESSDPNYDYIQSYLGFYFTRPEDTITKSNTLSIALASLQGADKTLVPQILTVEPSISVSAFPNFHTGSISVSATSSASTRINSFSLRAKVSGISFATVTIEGNEYLLNSTSYQTVSEAISEKVSTLSAPSSIDYNNETYNFVRWYNVTSEEEISTSSGSSITWDSDTQIEAQYIQVPTNPPLE